jgi:hypothetical protein
MPPKRTARRRPGPDRHVLYQRSVQSPDVELDFVDRVFRTIRGRTPARLREDFCGTGFTSCEWVRRRKANSAVGLDLHAPTLRWGVKHNAAALDADQQRRLRLLKRDVSRPGRGATGKDVVLAMNFSWWVLHERPRLLDYFRAVRASLVRDGLFILDIYGGWEAQKEQTDRRRIGGRKRGFTYLWDQARFDPINNRSRCLIHFKLANGRAIRRAFSYDWRLWTIPETRDVLSDAGFARTTVYWEGDDGRGGGNGIFRPVTRAECCASWIAYLVAEP